MKQNIVVIGGSSGIGKSIVEVYLENGDSVFNFSRTKPEINHLNLVHTDLDVLNFHKSIFEELVNIDSVFYCPGTINLKPFQSLKEKDVLNDFGVNALGAFKVLQELMPKIINKGSVLLFSSVAVQTGLKYHASISMAKGAVEGLVKALAAEWAPKIRVNGFSLSLINTPLASKFTGSDEKLKTAENRHPLQRIGNPQEIAKMAMCFSSKDAAWITGQILQIDGGMSSIREL